MSKHTPGPWVVSSLIVRASGNGYEVARVHCNFKIRGKEGRDEYEYAQGNAHLIAAAPEMLEALKAVLTAPIIYDGGGDLKSIDECGHDGLQPLREHLRAAIAKAEGRK